MEKMEKILNCVKISSIIFLLVGFFYFLICQLFNIDDSEYEKIFQIILLIGFIFGVVWSTVFTILVIKNK